MSEGASQKIDKGVFYYHLEQGKSKQARCATTTLYGSLLQKSCRKRKLGLKQCAKGMDAACSAAQMRP